MPTFLKSRGPNPKIHRWCPIHLEPHPNFWPPRVLHLLQPCLPHAELVFCAASLDLFRDRGGLDAQKEAQTAAEAEPRQEWMVSLCSAALEPVHCSQRTKDWNEKTLLCSLKSLKPSMDGGLGMSGSNHECHRTPRSILDHHSRSMP